MSNKISFISGNFNIIHAGHIRLFKFAKTISDKLIVGLYSDNLIAGHSFLNQKLRYESLSQLKVIDQIIIINRSLKSTILKVKPNYIVKGFEFTNIMNEELEIIKKINCELVFSSGESNIPLTSYRKSQIIDKYKAPEDFLNRHKLNKNLLVSIIEKFKKLKVTVIGDLIVDEYISCNPVGMSKETNNIVYSFQDKKKYLGGAGIVASHASQLGAKVEFISSCGYDKDGRFAIDQLKKNDVKVKLFKNNLINTVNKKRFKFGNDSLFRINHLNQKVLDTKLSKKIFDYFKKIIKRTDILIFSDFNYGLLDENLIEKIIVLAKKNKVFISADSQTSSQIGNIKKFKYANLITPTEFEARSNLNDDKSGVVILAEKLRENIKSENIILTQGNEGIFIHSHDNKSSNYKNDIIKPLNKEAYDVAGAGDSFLVACSLAMQISRNIWASSLLGSLASAIQVSREGNVPISNKELKLNL